MSMWRAYVPVHVRKQKAKKEMEKLRKKGMRADPVELNGNKIAVEFWGKKWCDHIDNFADFSNRLPRGRTYVRNGSVCHLEIEKGQVDAIVSGSELYEVSISIKTLAKEKWEEIKKRCNGLVGSILELLQGKLLKNVMQVVSDCHEGLFPSPKEISFDCSCPDWAGMCKHVAAVLYGIGSRLDKRPELLFHLRDVDPQELVTSQLNLKTEQAVNILQSDNLAELFGIQMDGMEQVPAESVKVLETKTRKKSRLKKKGAPFRLDAIKGCDIKKIRENERMSVTDFASALEVTPATIYRWESSRKALKLQSRPKKELEKMVDRLY